MCVAIPCRIVSLETGTKGARPARVSLPDGSIRIVDLVMVPTAEVGDFVITHSGFAVAVTSEETALTTIDLLATGASRHHDHGLPRI